MKIMNITTEQKLHRCVWMLPMSVCSVSIFVCTSFCFFAVTAAVYWFIKQQIVHLVVSSVNPWPKEML